MGPCRFFPVLLVTAAILAAAGPSAARDGGTAANAVAIQLRAADGGQAVLDYRPGAGARVEAMTAAMDGTALPLLADQPYPWNGAVTAILFLMDSSASRHPQTLQRNAQDIARMVAEAPPRFRFGLAAFDADLRLLVPPGGDRTALAEAARSVTAKGQTTELFRNARTAIDLLSRFPADRRALVVLSDGDAEDTAYRREDVVAAARQAGVAIIGLGFAEKQSLTPDLQSLRRLAEETGGQFVAGGPDHALPPEFLRAPFAAIEDGGRAVVDLRPAASPFHAIARPLALTVVRGGTSSTVVLPPVGVPRRPPTAREIAAAAGIAAVLLCLAGLAWRRHRRTAAEPSAAIAFLGFLDADGRTIPITTTQVTIGRGDQGNGISLANDPISRHHATILRRRDGGFEIRDLASANGVEVNDRKVDHAQLADGDLIGLGEVRFRFHLPRMDGGPP